MVHPGCVRNNRGRNFEAIREMVKDYQARSHWPFLKNQYQGKRLINMQNFNNVSKSKTCFCRWFNGLIQWHAMHSFRPEFPYTTDRRYSLDHVRHCKIYTKGFCPQSNQLISCSDVETNEDELQCSSLFVLIVSS